jgi:hypothetical protein
VEGTVERALDFAEAIAWIGVTMPRTIKDEIIRQVERLDPPEQRKVLDFARGLSTLAGTPGGELLKICGLN